MADICVVNVDDPASLKILGNADGEIVTYSLHHDEAVMTAKNINLRPTGASYELVARDNIIRISINLPGEFNVYNSIAAASTAFALGVPMSMIKEALSVIEGVKGRLEVVPTNTDYTVIIDYAHTPDGIVNVLNAVRGFTSGRVICLFGCGGDRDKTKRPLMGEAAAMLSDYVIVTSDNPRSESPEAIIDDILSGMTELNTPYKVIADRTEAIAAALKEANEGDVVVLAGKGHETYQVLKEGKIHYDEREIVKELLQE